jgi:hypothetical protein
MRLPVRLRWVFLAIITIWISGSLVFQSPRDGDVNSVEAAKPRFIAENNLELVLTADGPSDMIGCLQNCWFAGSSDSKIVLFQDNSEDDDRFHFSLLGQYGNKWHRTGESSITLPDPTEEDLAMSVMTSRYPEGSSWMYRWGVVQDHTVTVGRIDPAKVARVDLVHDTGEISSAWPNGEYFVDFTPGNAVCDAFAVDHQGEVIDSLSSDSWSGIGHLGPGGVQGLCD